MTDSFLDELGYELEVMEDLPQYQTERDFFHSPLSPSHLQDDFRNQDGITDTEILSDRYRHPPPQYDENMRPMSPPPRYQEREANQVSSEERY